LAAALAEDVWLLDEGRLVAAGPTEHVMPRANLEQVVEVSFEGYTDPAGRRVLLPQSPERAWATRMDSP
jgi:ABC-type cobalamin transport system ATPase subunit